MTIHELLAKIHAEKIELQMLSDCMVNMNTNKQGISKITFGTSAITATQCLTDSGKVGMVLWIDRDEWVSKIQGSVDL